MIKIFFVLSVLLNLILGFVLYKQAQKPPLERIIIEHKKSNVESVTPYARQNLRPRKTQPDPTSNASEISPNEQDHLLEVEELEEVKREFLDTLNLEEKVIKGHEKLMQEYSNQAMEVYRNNQTGANLSLEQRRKLLDLEEGLHQKLEKLYGKEKWRSYKKFVDDYNQKVIKNQKPDEPSGLLMGY